MTGISTLVGQASLIIAKLLYNNPQLFSIDDVLAQTGQAMTGQAIMNYANRNASNTMDYKSLASK